ncbi:MAG: YncE family protein, partial [Planctomycetota bacterium]
LEIDRETGAVVRSFPVGYFPTELTVAPDGTELFVTTSTESTLFRIDLGTGAVTPIPLSDSLGGPIGYLSGIALDATGTRVIVTSNGGSFDGSSENVVVVDRASGAITARWTVAGAMNRLAVRGDGRVVLPVGFPGDDFTAAPVVQIIDMVNDQPVLAATLPLAVDTADFPQPSDVVLSPDGTRAYVTVFGGSADVFVIDVDAASLLPPLSLGGPEFAQSAVVASPDGAALAVADFFAGRLRVIARLSGAPVAEVPGLDLPNHVAVSSGRLVVSEQGQERISLVALTGSFLRADANGDTQVNLADGVAILNYLFAGGSLPCLAPADVDDDGVLDLADAISVFSYLFQGGTPPAAPFPYAGADPTAPVALDCP